MDGEEFVIKRLIAFRTLNSNTLRSYANSASDEIDRMRADSVESRTEIDYWSGVTIARVRARVESDIERVLTNFESEAVLVTKSSLQRSVYLLLKPATHRA
jgi:hypothetical protein